MMCLYTGTDEVLTKVDGSRCVDADGVQTQVVVCRYLGTDGVQIHIDENYVDRH